MQHGDRREREVAKKNGFMALLKSGRLWESEPRLGLVCSSKAGVFGPWEYLNPHPEGFEKLGCEEEAVRCVDIAAGDSKVCCSNPEARGVCC